MCNTWAFEHEFSTDTRGLDLGLASDAVTLLRELPGIADQRPGRARGDRQLLGGGADPRAVPAASRGGLDSFDTRFWRGESPQLDHYGAAGPVSLRLGWIDGSGSAGASYVVVMAW
jgi:hypothetical protein